MLIIAQVLKEKWLKITGFAHSQQTTANDSGAPNENIVQNHLNIALLNVF